MLGDYEHFQQGMLVKALDLAGISHGPGLDSRADVAIFWNPWSRLDVNAVVPADAPVPVINGGAFHCSKSNVTRHFEAAFGYDLGVDPTTFVGPMARKADENAAHDGVTVVGPLAPSDVVDGQIYQRLISNTFGPSAVDVRVSIVRTVRERCYVKLRPIEDRYSNVNSTAWLAPTRTLLTDEEIERINAFCRSIELDFGQLDLCRDNGSGLLYIVDANNTPFGPANGMSEWDGRAAVRALAEDFASEFGVPATYRTGE